MTYSNSNDIINEYLKWIKEYKYSTEILESNETIDKFLLFYLFSVSYENNKFDIPSELKDICKNVYVFDYTKRNISRNELPFQVFYELFKDLEEKHWLITNKETIENLIFNLYKRWFIWLKINEEEIEFRDFSKWYKYFKPEIHIFSKKDRIFITQKWIKEFNFLTKSSTEDTWFNINEPIIGTNNPEEIRLSNKISYSDKYAYLKCNWKLYPLNINTKPFIMVKHLISNQWKIVRYDSIVEKLNSSWKQRKSWGNYSTEEIYYIFKNIWKTSNLKIMENLVIHIKDEWWYMIRDV